MVILFLSHGAAFCCISATGRGPSLCLSAGGGEIESSRYALVG